MVDNAAREERSVAGRRNGGSSSIGRWRVVGVGRERVEVLFEASARLRRSALPALDHARSQLCAAQRVRQRILVVCNRTILARFSVSTTTSELAERGVHSSCGSPSCSSEASSAAKSSCGRRAASSSTSSCASSARQARASCARAPVERRCHGNQRLIRMNVRTYGHTRNLARTHA